MPRRPRIDLPGFHHVVNRGVDKRDIFLDDSDFEVFLGIVCKGCEAYRVVLHVYALMRNHFHLLVETEFENLSFFMKHVNSNYAIYFNKKYKRSGHLWQGRFYSRYITNDTYYYTLVRYIEQNPIHAGIVSSVGEYPYTLGSVIINGKTPVKCAKGSRLIRELNRENIQDMIGTNLDDEAMKILDDIRMQKVIEDSRSRRIAKNKTLSEHFGAIDGKGKNERNIAITEALADGYTQAEIAEFLGLSRSAVCKIVGKEVKSKYSTPDPLKCSVEKTAFDIMLRSKYEGLK